MGAQEGEEENVAEKYIQTPTSSHHHPTTSLSLSSSSSTWGTWEDLLLSSAVKRHGFKNWDTVAMELQTRTSLPLLLTTPHNCQLKYNDLHRRFSNSCGHDNGGGAGGVDSKFVNIPWIDELRKLRVAELKQEVQRYDVSILSLQRKVKKLEEERDMSVQENNLNQGSSGDGGGGVPDLDRSQNDNKQEKSDRHKGDESDRENRSVNESNSTASGGKPDDGKAVKLEDSNSKPVVAEEEDVGDSVTQLSSEEQSSASLGKKRKRKEWSRRKEIGNGGDGEGKERVAVKSEPLVGVLEIIRAHLNVCLFERRLQTQETEDYRKMIRQHLDLETIQTRLEQGSYSCSTLSFYRDLMLLFNNAIVFFPKSSTESETAHQLRFLVSYEMRKETHKSDSSPAPQNDPSQPKQKLERSDSLLALHKSSVPLIVCRKRSSLSAKPSSSSSAQKIEQQLQKQQQQEVKDNKSSGELKQASAEQSLPDIKSEEKPITGARSTRRNNKNLAKSTSSPNKKQNASPGTKSDVANNKSETPKAEKNKSETSAILEKKRSAADFLKRIKKNSPVEPLKKNNTRSNGELKTKSGGKALKGKERVLRKNNNDAKEESSLSKKSGGKSSKKGVAEGSSKSASKRGREGGGTAEAKRPRKRSRR